jgi:hypothetical protein
MITRNSLLLLLTISFAFSACRKGEEDPLISFHSRKTRIAGDWNVTTYKKEQTTLYLYPNGTSSKLSFTQSYGPINYQETSIDTTNTPRTNSGKMSRSEFRFTKSGNWNSLLEYYVYVNQAIGGYYISKIRVEEDGTWEFKAKSGDLKNKEGMEVITKNSNHFYYTYSTYLGTVVDSVADSTYSTIERKANWKIIGLSNTRLKAEIVDENTLTSTIPGLVGTKITTSSSTEIEMLQ